MHTRTTSAARAALLLTCLAALAACGGGEPGAMAGPDSSAANTSTTTPPLFDAAGRPLLSPSDLMPRDTAARTRPGLYATRQQLEWQELTSSPSTVLLDLEQLGSAEAALVLAQHVHHWRGLQGLAYFVRGGSASDAALVVNTLADMGVAPVYLVR